MNLNDFKNLPDGTCIYDRNGCEYARKKGENLVYRDGTKLKVDSDMFSYNSEGEIEGLMLAIERDGIILFQEELDENADYYTVQLLVDGFGNDTATCFSSKSVQKCIDWLKENIEEDNKIAIVGQYFDTEFNDNF